jgi:metallo-beta-lactamase family protein
MDLDHSSPPPAVVFWGAAQRVTGSMHLLKVAGKCVALDCGLYLGSRSEASLPPEPFPFAAAHLHAVVLSHAHIDHCGKLPQLVREGFTGPIYCTPATRDLVGLVLADSARIQEEEAWVRTVLEMPRPAGKPERSAHADVHQILDQCVPVAYDQPCEIAPDVSLRLLDAGHILGSAMTAVTAWHQGRAHTLTFTGDLGRPGMGFLPDPAPVPAADLLISECTYGGRRHEPVEATVAALADVVQRTVERGGKVLIPAFSLGRTQLVIHYLNEGMRHGRMPRVRVWVDSPLAGDIASVYRQYPELLFRMPPAESPAAGNGLADAEVTYLGTAEEAREVSAAKEPGVIVASGGMCEGGRILNHLMLHLDDPRCSVVLVSYQAGHTLGRRLLERGPTVRFRGRRWNKWADIVQLTGFSGHADHDDLLASLDSLAGQTRSVRLVHGEPHQAEALAGDLRARGFEDVAVPARGDRVELGTGG